MGELPQLLLMPLKMFFQQSWKPQLYPSWGKEISETQRWNWEIYPVNLNKLLLPDKEITVVEKNFDPFSFLMAFWLLGTDLYLCTNLEKKSDAKQQFSEIFCYFRGFKQLQTKEKLDFLCIVSEKCLLKVTERRKNATVWWMISTYRLHW